MSRPRPRAKTASGPARLVALNKPAGVLSQWTGDAHWPGLSSILALPGFYPAGRLDRDSEGLLLLTNDGALQARLTDPASQTPKSYAVLLEGQPSAQTLNALRTGVPLHDGPTRPAQVSLIARPDWLWPGQEPPGTWLEITITEGRNRQIRRMGAHVDHTVLRLVRHAIGPYRLGDLAPGAHLEITP